MTAWGWIHLILGIVVLATGFGLFSRSTWAGVTAIIVIALNVWVIWSLTRPGAINT